MLAVYDTAIMVLSYFFVFKSLHGGQGINAPDLNINFIVFYVCIILSRAFGQIYSQIWRYGGIQGYIRLICTDTVGFIVFYVIQRLSPLKNVEVLRFLSLASINLLLSLVIRMLYRYAFKCGSKDNLWGKQHFLLLEYLVE